MAYLSFDLRRRIIEALKTEPSSLIVAGRFKVSSSAVRKLRVKYVATGEFAAGTAPGRERLVQGKREKQLLEIVTRHPDATLNVLCELFEDKVGVSLSETTMWRQLRRMGMTLKKEPLRRRAGAAGRNHCTRCVLPSHQTMVAPQTRLR